MSNHQFNRLPAFSFHGSGRGNGRHFVALNTIEQARAAIGHGEVHRREHTREFRIEKDALIDTIRKTQAEKLSRLERIVSSSETDPASVDLLETCLSSVGEIFSQSRHKMHTQLLHWRSEHRHPLSRVEELENELKALRASLASNEVRMRLENDLQATLRAKNDEINDLKARLEVVDEEKDAALDQQQAREKSFSVERGGMEAEISALRSQVAGLIDRRVEVDATNAELVSKLARANSAKELVEQEKSELEGRLSQVKESSNARTTQLRGPLNSTSGNAVHSLPRTPLSAPSLFSVSNGDGGNAVHPRPHTLASVYTVPDGDDGKAVHPPTPLDKVAPSPGPERRGSTWNKQLALRPGKRTASGPSAQTPKRVRSTSSTTGWQQRFTLELYDPSIPTVLPMTALQKESQDYIDGWMTHFARNSRFPIFSTTGKGADGAICLGDLFISKKPPNTDWDRTHACEDVSYLV
ncbi:hypothetical protein W97_03573 [Coniosporium apollinis CBS 100218]|uniref:Uncharacterized protein n=1 Tax=Coniosporium apollinis (strain CBS 100218) TaxID=1168221 RepID=R7YR00_CONA1|nr:uncharacterized protein W97_03573 [Coniosporium apollinis CBS 100218]EON64342.1 hypothetical protein W97_03573 [Coniosporium apollinis CBS 100218]